MKELSKSELIERSIIKKYRTKIWRKFVNAIDEYKLVKENDKIAVCISGGKDSFLMAKCFQELQKRSTIKFEIVFLVMNPGYNPQNLQLIQDNAVVMNVPITIFPSDIFDIVAQVGGSPCYLCARMRRGFLYKTAQSLGCNKIALGHHMDDVIETILMSMFYGSEYKTMMPKLKSANFAGMELIRPMYMIREADIIAWARFNELQFLRCACRLTENCVLGDDGFGGKRAEMKELIKRMEKINPNIGLNIFKSVHNVNLDTVIAYRQNGQKHSFLDNYDNINNIESQDD
ncbi:MAG TPA: ATP-binding protein [Clostridia bacterium]